VAGSRRWHPKFMAGFSAGEAILEHEAAQRLHGPSRRIDLLASISIPSEATWRVAPSWDETIENIDVGAPP